MRSYRYLSYKKFSPINSATALDKRRWPVWLGAAEAVYCPKDLTTMFEQAKTHTLKCISQQDLLLNINKNFLSHNHKYCVPWFLSVCMCTFKCMLHGAIVEHLQIDRSIAHWLTFGGFGKFHFHPPQWRTLWLQYSNVHSTVHWIVRSSRTGIPLFLEIGVTHHVSRTIYKI